MKIHCCKRLHQGVPNIFETMGSFGILTQRDGGNHRMAATEGKADHKMAVVGQSRTHTHTKLKCRGEEG